jgi:PDZ domain/Aspartyl protease
VRLPLAAVLALLSASGVGGQEAPRAGPVTIAGGAHSAVLPFELVDNRIVIACHVNGRGPFRLILDSGGGALVSDSLVRRLALAVTDTFSGVGAGERVQHGGRTAADSVRCGAVTVREQPLNFTSFDDARHVFGAAPVDGVIGYPLLSQLVTSVDYQRRRVTFVEPRHFRARPTDRVIRFELAGVMPQVRGAVDTIPGTFGVDLGARTSLLLYGAFVEQHGLRALYPPRLEGITGWGIGGPIRSQVARVRTFSFGGVTLRDVVARYSLQRSGALTGTERAGLIGPDILRQFVVTFDYPQRRLLLRKSPEFGARDTWDRSGMWLGQDDTGFVVLDVMAGGPAAEAGLTVGDHILAIDGRPVERLALPEVRRRLKTAPSGRAVRLLVSSSNGRRTVVLVPRDLV